MHSSTSPLRSHTYDLPKPEDGLAEWASKIKALQQQVDADEEAEHKRLEEEIAASRLARKRRSRGYGSRRSSADFASSTDSILSTTESQDDTSRADLKPIVDRQKGQAEAFQRLVGSSTHSSEAVNSIASARAWMASASARTASTSAVSEPMSLAAFMGGRATGPVLNKHAPQQDAHDPTQFEQRTRITSPHPVFGRGGVAMPGMASSGRFPRRNDAGAPPSPISASSKNRPSGNVVAVDERSHSPSKAGIRDKSNTPNISSRPPFSPLSPELPVPDIVMNERSISPQRTGTRERTISTPSTFYSSPTVRPSSSASRHNGVAQERPVSPQKTGSKERRMSTPGASAPLKVSFALPSTSDETVVKARPASTTPLRPKTPTQDSSKSPPYKSPVTTPSLARPIQPEPRSPPQSLHVPSSQNPSPAFLKPSAQKDPTPSLSRLQGRGFVQNMVKVSQQLEVTPPPSGPTTPERSQSGGRKASVLDRWQPRSSTSLTPVSPPASPKPIALRKSWTVDSSATKTASPEPRKVNLPPKPTKPTVSFGGKEDSMTLPLENPSAPLAAQTTGGLGSATTLVVFKPPLAEEELAPYMDVSELGVKANHHSPSPQQKLPVSAGKPLIHPTRERARKPKKIRSSAGLQGENRTPGDGVSVLPPYSPSTPQPDPLGSASSSKVGHSFPDDVSKAGPAVSKSSDADGSGNAKRVTDRWAEQAIIGVKTAQTHSHSYEPEAPKGPSMVGRRALPGMVPTTGTKSNDTAPAFPALPVAKSDSSEKSPTTPSVAAPKYPFDGPRPSTPNRPTRIPSTGNRPTVMDVAQTLNNQNLLTEVQSPVEEQIKPQPVHEPPPISPTTGLSPRMQNIAPPPLMERRRSSYNEKYSVITLPPLKEEATPLPTPVGSLKRGVVPADGASAADVHKALHEVFNTSSAIIQEHPVIVGGAGILHLSHVEQPLPKIDIETLLSSRPSFNAEDPNISTISVEVMSIDGNRSTVISHDNHVFYDSEVLAIVHRSKSKASGLVSTTVWGWFGKNSQAGEREESKLQDLSKRYGTSTIIVHQYSEPRGLVQVLGGRLAVRQGLRAHWSADNTAMHIVRSAKGGIWIDELELSAKNLCSAFSYCFTILDSIYVWYGRGSVTSERQAALEYAQSLGENIVEISEGQSDDNEMFWMLLGEESFAKADYWKWRNTSDDIEPMIWKVDCLDNPALCPIESFNSGEASHSVYFLDCVWELFVLVGANAREQQQDIRLAISIANDLAHHVAPKRPHVPPVHVVILPSQIPLDLRCHFRGLDEVQLNGSDVPDHMNILTSDEARDHLNRRSWEAYALRDHRMLPLGVYPDLLT